MPSIIPSYVYTLFASMVVGAMLTVAFSISTLNTKQEAEEQQLRSLAEYFATKSCELAAMTTADKSSANLNLNTISFVGNQRYWVQLGNDSFSAWVEIGYGTIPHATIRQVLIPTKVSASGIYISGSGPATLQCYRQETTIYLNLSGGF